MYHISVLSNERNQFPAEICAPRNLFPKSASTYLTSRGFPEINPFLEGIHPFQVLHGSESQYPPWTPTKYGSQAGSPEGGPIACTPSTVPFNPLPDRISAGCAQPQSQNTPAAPVPERTVQDIDALFKTAGLVRNLRGMSGGVTRRVRRKQVTPEELSGPAPVPTVSPNGVQILKIPAWEELAHQGAPWLWHGFSTRKGGLSRAYCSEDTSGELNLGFTAADDRETVARNRRLLVEAVTGDPSTPWSRCARFTPAWWWSGLQGIAAGKLHGKATAL